MSIMFIFLITCVSATCPKYGCTEKKVTLSSGACSKYSDSRYYITPCEDKVENYCDFSENAESYCKVPEKEYAYPGEKCSEENDCLYSVFGCKNNVCQGAAVDEECADSHMCSPGNYCNSNHKCVQLIKEGQSGCTSDFDCVNTAVCDNSTCITYSSLSPGTQVYSCSKGRNYACDSNSCGLVNSIYTCLDPYGKKGSNPVSCSSSADCNSQGDMLYNYVSEGVCSCGHNENADKYCDVLPGESEYQSFLEMSKKWHSGKAVLKCNTMRRRADKCIKDWWGYSNKIKLLYWTKLVWEYPILVDMDYCVETALHGEFKEIKKSYQSLNQ